MNLVVRSPLVVRLMAILVLILVAAPAVHAATPPAAEGILVVTPDRGFLGNAEIRDAFDAFAKGRNAQLLFVTDRRSEKILDGELATLRKHGVKRFAVLPLVLSRVDPRWQLAQGWLKQRQHSGESWIEAAPYGESYLAVEDLADRLRHVKTEKQRLLLVGDGSNTGGDTAALQQQLQRMGVAASRLNPDAVAAVVLPVHVHSHSDDDEHEHDHANPLADAHGALVVPLAFATRPDSHMNFTNGIAAALPADAQLLSAPIATTAALTQWMQRASNEAGLAWQPVTAKQVGIIAQAYGSDWFWNHAIEDALAPDAHKYDIAYAFTHADPVVVQRAVRELEGRHARAIVLVGAFAVSTTFKPGVEHMFGLDLARNGASDAKRAPAHGVHGAADAGPHTLAAQPRIRTALPVAVVGGVDASPWLAKGLLYNARAVSKDPARETVILVAHGTGDDVTNNRWLALLENLKQQMLGEGGNAFRAIRYGAWREHWPAKRTVAVARIRDMVREAQRDGGRALIIPARENGRGPAREFLPDTDFGWGQGFVQTPYFRQWFEQQIGIGVKQLRAPHASPSDA